MEMTFDVVKTELSAVDKFSITKTMKIIADIDDHFGDTTDLISTSTGELIRVKELSRVLGVLSALRDTELWKID